MHNIQRAMEQAGLPSELRLLPHPYNFVPPLLPLALRGNWAGPARLVHSGSRAGFALRAPGRPLVVTVHHLVADPAYQPYTRPAQRLFHLLERAYDGLSIQRADAVACVSDYTRRQVAQIYGCQTARVVYNGVDTDAFRPLPGEHPPETPPFRLFFVGNRTRRKGSDLLDPLLARLGPDYELVYSGGQRENELPITAPNSRALGQLSLPDLVRAYNRCHALIFPSRLEGFGLAVAEAMACGRPVVASRCSALPELVVEGQGGFLCPVDDVDALAQAVQRLAEDPNLRREMGRFNRRRAVSQFSLPVMAENYRRLYAELGFDPV
ncbi:MAG: glycosyltransferase family 4 protein [Chloroflexia bacterium]|nr:glycosyltransferase family 4 protein [Chloroflexia bacterium]